jgi:hypothetical protein
MVPWRITMRRYLTAGLALCFVLSGLSLARADEAADMKDLVEKGVKSLGGEEKLAKMKGITVKAKGKFYGFGDGVDFTSTTYNFGTDKIRTDIEGDMGGNKFNFTQIYNNGKGWAGMGTDAQEMPEDNLNEIKHSLYVNGLTRLNTLSGKEFTLKSLGDSKVGDAEALGIKVSSKDHKDVSLFLDKKTGLVLKTETAVKDVMGGGEEQKEERLYADYKDHDGLKYPNKVTINRDSKKFVEQEATEVKFSEKLEDNLFAKPGT